MLFRTRPLLTGLAGTVALATVLSGCGTLPGDPLGGSRSTAPTSAPAAGEAPAPGSATASPVTPPVELDPNVDDGASKVEVSTLVQVKAKGGTVSKVDLTYSGLDSKGRKVKGSVDGALKDDGSSWSAKERLEPSATYTLAMTGRNVADQTSTTTTTFTTQKLTLAEQTFPSVYPLPDSKVGVGMPVVINFDVPVSDKAAVEKNLHVTSKPAQPGTWSWLSSTQVRYRTKNYWKPGTKVTVNADLNGVDAGNGVYGQKSATTNFTVGRSMIIRVNLASDVATVSRNGKKVRTMYVSGGKPNWETRSGTKLIMAKEYNKRMTNEMIGAEEDYSLVAKYALRITNSGEFLHSAPWNAAHFGVRNASHGCVGMSVADSAWLYQNTLIGDPVVTTGTSRGLEQGNGYSDWNVSYATYAKGSAL